MTLTIATSFDNEKRAEAFTTFRITEALALEVLQAMLQKMDYEDREAWLTEQHDRGQLSVTSRDRCGKI